MQTSTRSAETITAVKNHVHFSSALHCKKYICKISEKALVAHYTQHHPLILQAFLLTLKHNAMKCKIQNTGKTPMEKFLQIQYIVPYLKKKIVY